MATRDRAGLLERALDALAAQEFAGNWEVVVVDDASADRTPEVLAERAKAGAIRVVRRDSPGGPAGARNSGWLAARGRLIAFTDDDCEPAPGWLAAIAAAAGDDPNAFAQGPTAPNPSQLDRMGPFSRTLDVRDLGPWYPTCNVAYSRALLERIGGFDEALPRGEDTDLAWRAMEAGAVPRWAPDALVHHAVLRIGPLAKLRVAAGWRRGFVNFARHPALREQLVWRIFWKRSHALLLLALAGLALGRRFPPALLLAIPYARDVRARMIAEGATPAQAGFYPLHDAFETATAAAGSVQHRMLVL